MPLAGEVPRHLEALGVGEYAAEDDDLAKLAPAVAIGEVPVAREPVGETRLAHLQAEDPDAVGRHDFGVDAHHLVRAVPRLRDLRPISGRIRAVVAAVEVVLHAVAEDVAVVRLCELPDREHGAYPLDPGERQVDAAALRAEIDERAPRGVLLQDGLAELGARSRRAAARAGTPFQDAPALVDSERRGVRRV